MAGGWWLVAGGWWLVAGGWWLVAGEELRVSCVFVKLPVGFTGFILCVLFFVCGNKVDNTNLLPKQYFYHQVQSEQRKPERHQP